MDGVVQNTDQEVMFVFESQDLFIPQYWVGLRGENVTHLISQTALEGRQV